MRNLACCALGCFDQPRRSQYPVLGGQGHDIIVVHKWLSEFLGEFTVAAVVLWH